MRREGVNILRRVARFDPEARAAIRERLSDPSPRVREQAAQKLRDLKDKESAPKVMAAMIGLAIVHQLTLAMNGGVDMINAEPGAEFRVWFPIAE